jgi:hypothetical protein
MTVHDVLIQYESRLSELQTGIANARLNYHLGAVVLALATALFLTLGIYAIREQIAYWWPSLPIPVAAVSARRYRQQRESRFRMSRLQRFYERAIERIQGTWAGSGATGEEFSEPDHVYAEDLHIFGEGSLFQLLCTARTAIGRRGMADYLLEAPAQEETLLRQEAVRELSELSDLRERVALLGASDVSESRWSTFEDWLSSPRLSFPSFVRVLAAATSICVAAVLLAGALGVISWVHVAIWMSPFVAFHSIVGFIFRGRVNKMENWVRPVSVETQVLREGLRLIETEPFRSAKLRHLVDQVRNAARAVRRLELLLNALNERRKEWFYTPSLLLLLGTQICMAIARWHERNGESLKMWIRAWAEFEALNSLATYAHENPDNTFPEVTRGGPNFEARDLGHPLLPRTSCVVNDVELNRQTRFYVISGSNMSGKSTLLRAVGLNAVLASAGAPVRATALRMSRLSVCASMSVVDSLLSAKSRFLAEVDRIRQTIEAAEDRPVLFLVDEIFSGTNSRDRRIAADAVVRTLVDRGAIGALSTHDVALSEIADAAEPCGVNMHMGAREGGGPMDFDYRLKPGVTTESNALAIARMAGVPV